MRAPFVPLVLVLAAGGCAGLPELVPMQAGPQRAALLQRCRAIPPRVAFGGVHTIGAGLPMTRPRPWWAPAWWIRRPRACGPC